MIGRLRRFDLKYNFEVQIEGLSDMAFATCSEPTGSVGEAMLWQGGSLIPIKEPTRLTFADITLERGMSRNLDIWNWFQSCSDAALASGFSGQGAGFAFPEQYKRGATIAQKDRLGTWVEMIHLFNAWPKECGLGDFNNDADEFRIERLVLSYDYPERVPMTPF